MFGQVFAALIRARQMMLVDGRVLVPRRAVRWDATGSHAAGIDDALHPLAPRRDEQVARADQVRIIDGPRVARPQAVVGGDVRQRVTALERLLQAGRAAQIARAW